MLHRHDHTSLSTSYYKVQYLPPPPSVKTKASQSITKTDVVVKKVRQIICILFEGIQAILNIQACLEFMCDPKFSFPALIICAKHTAKMNSGTEPTKTQSDASKSLCQPTKFKGEMTFLKHNKTSH